MNESVWIEAIVLLLILSGALLILLSAFGIVRFPDVYTRLHAAAKSSTLGILFILLGAFLYFLLKHEEVSIRLLLGIIFIFLTTPVAAQLISRSAYRSGVSMAKNSVRDDLQGDMEETLRSVRGEDAADERRD